MDDMVVSSRFTPAFVSPEATAIGKHTGEVADSSNAWSGKARTSIGVGPGVAAVSGSVNEIAIGVGEATAAFVHAGDVNIARSKVAGDLDITDEGSASRNLSRVSPSHAIIGGIAEEEGTRCNIEVVPGNVHPPIEWATRVIVGPTRLPVVLTVAVNAIMGPASRAHGISGLVPTKALTAAATVKPDGEPCSGRAVVQNNGVAKGIGKGALVAGRSDAGEGVSPIGGDRYTGEIAGGGASRIVVRDDDLVGIIWVSGSVRLRLDNVRRCLGASYEVDVRSAKCCGFE